MQNRIVTNTAKDEKLLFHYTIDNGYMGFIDSSYFKNDDISKVYKFFKNYYSKWGKNPSPKIIYNELIKEDEEAPTKETIAKIFKRGDYDDLIKNDPDWMYNKWVYFYKTFKVSEKVYNYIHKARNGNIDELAKELDIDWVDEDSEDDEGKSALKNSKILDDKLFDNLPLFLKEIFDLVELNSRDRDTMFLSMLISISSLFENVYTWYHNRKEYSNLYLFLAAPPSSGKGLFSVGRNILKRFNEHEISENQNLEENFKRHVMPGNNSASAFIRQLEANGGSCLLFESEADTISNNRKNEWGDYSDTLRNGFHNEPIRMSRVKDNLDISIEEPKISVAISGTINQLMNFIGSPENGLYSRFMYYLFDNELEWKDGFSNSLRNINLEDKSKELFEFATIFKNNMFEFMFTEDQQNKLNNVYNDWLRLYESNTGEYFTQVVKRSGTQVIKIAMVLSILRKMEDSTITNESIFNQRVDNNIICEDIDFENALSIGKTLLEHSSLLYYNITKEDVVNIKKDPREEIFEKLGNEFRRQEAIDLFPKGTSSKTVDRWLKSLKDNGLVSKKNRFVYTKL